MNMIERYIKNNIWTYVTNVDISIRKPSKILPDKNYSVILTFSDALKPSLVRKYLELSYEQVVINIKFYNNHIRLCINDPVLSYFGVDNNMGIAELVVKNLDVRYGEIKHEHNR